MVLVQDRQDPLARWPWRFWAPGRRQFGPFGKLNGRALGGQRKRGARELALDEINRIAGLPPGRLGRACDNPAGWLAGWLFVWPARSATWEARGRRFQTAGDSKLETRDTDRAARAKVERRGDMLRLHCARNKLPKRPRASIGAASSFELAVQVQDSHRALRGALRKRGALQCGLRVWLAQSESRARR